MRGSMASARASAMRWRWPPDSWFGRPLPERTELHQLEQLIYPRANLGLARTQTARARTQPERHILEHRHVAEKRVVLEHETDIALADAARQRVLAVEMHLALIGPVQARR